MSIWKSSARIALILLGLTVMTAVPASAAAQLDQSSALSGGGSSVINSNQQNAQLFTAGLSGSLTRVELGLSSTNAVTSLTVFITAASNGTPTGPTLSTVTLSTSDLASVTTTPSMLSVTFPAPATIVAGNQYAINATTTGSNSLNWHAGATYAGGNFAVYAAPTWYTYNFDVAFATYVDSAPSFSGAATFGPSPVLQEFGKPVTGTCDAAQPAGLDWAGVPNGGWANSWSQWMNGGTGGFVCTRTLVYSTTQAKWVLA